MPRRLIVVALVAAVASAAAPGVAEAAGDNVDTPGVVRAESGAWRWWLSNDFDANVAYHFQVGSPGSTPLAGDWDGDGDDTAGVTSAATAGCSATRTAARSPTTPSTATPGDVVALVGDWDGDGRDTIANRRDHCFQFNNASGGSSPRHGHLLRQPERQGGGR